VRKDIKIYDINNKAEPVKEKILAARGSNIDDPEKDTPLGSNQLRPDLLFEERLFYRDKAFQQIDGEDFGLIDLWNTVREFGKTDTEGQPVYPSEYYLKQVTSTDRQDIFAINYVVDAFEEMVYNSEAYIRKAGGVLPMGSLSESTIFPLAVKKGHQSATLLYHKHIASMYEAFTNDYLSNKHSKILTFEHFVKHFIDFCHVAAEETPVFFSSFIQSVHCPVNINGYTLEIDDADAGDDEVKFNNYINSPLFQIYKRMAITHGFMIDKNVPWRLIANLNHPKMKLAAQKEILLGDRFTVKKGMQVLFKQAAETDIELLKFHMASFYNSYISFMPSVDVPYVKDCFVGKATLVKGVATRSPINAFNADQDLDTSSLYYADYDDKFWLNFYYHIKLIEGKIKLGPSKIHSNMRKIFNHYSVHGLEKTVKHIISDVNEHRAKQNIKRGTFTDSNSDIILYDKLGNNTPAVRELEVVGSVANKKKLDNSNSFAAAPDAGYTNDTGGSSEGGY
jgi:hypothetical protein